MSAHEKNPIPAKNKAVMKYLCAAFGASASDAVDVHAYRDDVTDHAIDVLRVSAVPEEGIDSVATLTLSDHPLKDYDGNLRTFGVEFIAIGESGDDRIANILTTCALNIIKDDWIIAPDAIFPGVVAMYNEGGNMEHALFVDPLLGLWPEDIVSVDHADGKVVFLQMIPISNSEYNYAIKHSVDALLDKILDTELSPHDLDRASVV